MGIFSSNKNSGKNEINRSFLGIKRKIRIRNPRKLKYFVYNQLPVNKQEIYYLMWKKLREFSPEFTFPKNNLTADEVYEILNAVIIDHPGIFWINDYSCMSLSHTSDTYYAKPKYNMTKAEANRRRQEINKAVIPFVKSIKKNKGDYEVVKLAYENIINLIDYDTIGLNEQQRSGGTNPGVPDDLRSIYGVFVNKKAVCAGYARATQYLLNRLGIECAYIRGYISSEDPSKNDVKEGKDPKTGKKDADYHAWNLLKLEGDYYYMDTTWGDRSNTTDTPEESDKHRAIEYNYFCIDTQTLLKDHTPDEFPRVPVCTANSCNYFVREGLLLNKYSRDDVKKLIRKGVAAGQYKIYLRYTNEELQKQAKKDLVDDNEMWNILDEVIAKGTKINRTYRYVVHTKRYGLDLLLEKK